MPDVNVVFFASLKEHIGVSEHTIHLDLPITILELKSKLAKEFERGERILEPGIQSSMDYAFSRDADNIPENVKEIAFFPPVTGG